MKRSSHVCSISFFFQVFSGMDYESHGCTTETFYGPDDADKAIADAKAYAAKGKENTNDDWVAVFRCEIGGSHIENAELPGSRRTRKVEIFSTRIEYAEKQPDACESCHRGNAISNEPWEKRKFFPSDALTFCRECLSQNIQSGLEALRKTEEEKVEEIAEIKPCADLTCTVCGNADAYLAPELAGAPCRQLSGGYACEGKMHVPTRDRMGYPLKPSTN